MNRSWAFYSRDITDTTHFVIVIWDANVTKNMNYIVNEGVSSRHSTPSKWK